MPMPYDRSTNYEMIYAFLAIIVICILNLLGPYVNTMFKNIERDITLQEFVTAFGKLQQPAQTTQVSLKTAVGRFSTSQTSCDFFVGELRSYPGNQDEVRAAYASQSVQNAGEIQVVFVENGEIMPPGGQPFPESLKTLERWESTPVDQPLYIVYIVVTGYQGDSNLNCR